MSDTTALTVRFPTTIYLRLKAQAERDGKSMNGYIAWAVQRALESGEPESLDLKDSMESVAAALLDVQSRLDSLERLARQAGADF